jgi:hypothetical protein
MSVIGKCCVLQGKGKPNLNQNYIAQVTMTDMTYPALGAKNIWDWTRQAGPKLCLIYLELDNSQKECPALQKVKTREY